MLVHDLDGFVLAHWEPIVQGPVHAWTEGRKGSRQRYTFCRIQGKKHFLGSHPRAREIFLDLVGEERRRWPGFRRPPVEKVVQQRYRNASRALQEALLKQSGCGQVRGRHLRGLDREEDWVREFERFSRENLERRTWPGITLEQWVELRRAIRREIKDRARRGLTVAADDSQKVTDISAREAP